MELLPRKVVCTSALRLGISLVLHWSCGRSRKEFHGKRKQSIRGAWATIYLEKESRSLNIDEMEIS